TRTPVYSHRTNKQTNSGVCCTSAPLRGDVLQEGEGHAEEGDEQVAERERAHEEAGGAPRGSLARQHAQHHAVPQQREREDRGVGLNGSPVCAVNDDWFANTPLCPHPLIKSQLPASGNQPHPISYTPASGASGSRHGTALLSEAWQEELKDLATKVSLSAAGPSRGDDGERSRDEDPPRRKTQYSAQTGRIIPSSSWGTKRRDTATGHRRPATHRSQPTSLDGQELRVLELLCQILQTDSLSLVQQWLLLAGDREKELVLGLLQQAMIDSPSVSQQQLPFTAPPEPRTHNPSTASSRRKRRLKRLSSAQELLEEQPAHIGDAEVLQVRPLEDQNVNEDLTFQREHSR
uniref:Thymus, brain and testes associated n=1 Tax=Astyanax mexicanus TaxID=7994 RepID=A0A3B1IWA4_ASTMX